MDTDVAIDRDGYMQLLSGRDRPLPSIIIAGDLCPMGQSEELLSTNQVERLFPGIIQTLQMVDLAIANLECPLTRQTSPIVKSGPHLKADPACANGIRSAGFDVVSLANNHILDMGGGGLADTVAACTGAGLETVGVGDSLAQATRPLLIDVKGMRVAVLAFAETEFSIATPHSSGAWPVDPVNNFYQIKQAGQEAEFVLVMLHGGNEYYELPSPPMVKLCRYFVDVGAHAVVCNHVHVPGGIEVYRGAPIIYSTGNFLFEGEDEVDGWYKGFLVKLAIQPGAVVALQLIPYWQSKDQVGVRLMSHAEQGHFFAHLAEVSSVIADPVALEESWDRFVRSKRVQYLSSALGLTKVERRLLRSGLWPFWRLRRSAGAGLLNLFACESHRDVMTSLLTSEFLAMESQADTPV
jgi:poly-gamma-glutamate synthesis protein (capsule biosynthesis protein)